MGWVSMNEDIDELRAQQVHFQNGIDAIITQVRHAKFDDLAKAESDLRTKAERVESFLKALREKVGRVFDDAVSRLSDPNFRITKRLSKVEKERDQLKELLKDRDDQLKDGRKRMEELREENRRLTAKASALGDELSHLKDNELAWQGETKDINRRIK
ncbi:MAG: hypothetical protein U1E56_08330 [Bauldia sp.]